MNSIKEEILSKDLLASLKYLEVDFKKKEKRERIF